MRYSGHARLCAECRHLNIKFFAKRCEVDPYLEEIPLEVIWYMNKEELFNLLQRGIYANCFSAITICEYVNKQLATDEDVQVSKHIDDCIKCRNTATWIGYNCSTESLYSIPQAVRRPCKSFLQK